MLGSWVFYGAGMKREEEVQRQQERSGVMESSSDAINSRSAVMERLAGR